MASTVEYVNFVCEKFAEFGAIRHERIFGEYMIYVDDRPIVLVYNNAVYVKQLPELEKKFKPTDVAVPYTGAHPHYALSLTNKKNLKDIIRLLVKITPIPRPNIIRFVPSKPLRPAPSVIPSPIVRATPTMEQ